MVGGGGSAGRQGRRGGGCGPGGGRWRQSAVQSAVRRRSGADAAGTAATEK